MRHGRSLPEFKIERIKHLLAHSELTMAEIARYMRCSQGPVVAINRKFGIRDYGGHHLWFKLNQGCLLK